jgi:hypothetical protein
MRGAEDEIEECGAVKTIIYHKGHEGTQRKVENRVTILN